MSGMRMSRRIRFGTRTWPSDGLLPAGSDACTPSGYQPETMAKTSGLSQNKTFLLNAPF
jgi:hypothetical protein